MRAVIFSVLVSLQLGACVTGDNQVEPTQEEAQTDDNNNLDFDQLPDLEVDRSAFADPTDMIDQTLVDDSPRAPVDEDLPPFEAEGSALADLPPFEAALRALLGR